MHLETPRGDVHGQHIRALFIMNCPYKFSLLQAMKIENGPNTMGPKMTTHILLFENEFPNYTGHL